MLLILKLCVSLAKDIVVGPWAIDQALRERWVHPTFPSSIDGQQGHLNFNVLAVRISGRGEGVRVNPNIVRIVMHIHIYERSLMWRHALKLIFNIQSEWNTHSAVAPRDISNRK